VLSTNTSLSFPPPTITSDPESVTRYRGETAFFTVSSSGLAPLSYQWLKDGTNIPGQTLLTLTLTNLRTANAGSYRAIVTDAAGSSTTSAAAVLTIVDPTQTNSVTLIDTSIYSSGGNPMGVGSILAGTRRNGIVDRGLLRFDLTKVPRGAQIQSAGLRLRVIRIPAIPVNSNFTLHRMLRPWGPDATWANATAGVPWSTPGGQAGVDYTATGSATRFVTGGGAFDFGPSLEILADVNAWLANPGTNYGWILKSESEGSLGTARHFGSNESAQPPQLLLQYINPASARLTNVVAQAGKLTFRFDAADGWFYRVESRNNLESGAWTTVTNLPAGPARTIFTSVPITPPHRFYRVMAE
jgi:hypothetical protein